MATKGRPKIRFLVLRWELAHNPQMMFSGELIHKWLGGCHLQKTYNVQPGTFKPWVSVQEKFVNAVQKMRPLMCTLSSKSRWFCVEAGSSSNPSILLVHGFPSQAYSYRKVLPVLSEKYHVTAFDWLGFGFSDKPQPKYGFDYTLDEYTSSLESLVKVVTPDKLSIVVQGYFAPIVVKYASEHQDKLSHLILLNPPIMEKHAKLPSTLSLFSNFLLGEIFSQDPLRASDNALTSCGPYMMKEEDAMVYRRPYLVSGSSGFALNAISRAMKKDLKAYIESMRSILASDSWKTHTTICWGMRDRWLSYDGVEDYCAGVNHKLVELPMAGHHVQEDRGEELGDIINEILR